MAKMYLKFTSLLYRVIGQGVFLKINLTFCFQLMCIINKNYHGGGLIYSYPPNIT